MQEQKTVLLAISKCDTGILQTGKSFLESLAAQIEVADANGWEQFSLNDSFIRAGECEGLVILEKRNRRITDDFVSSEG